MKALSRTLAVTLLALGPAVAHAQSDYHHMHFSAPDTKAAAAWYTEHMGCEDFGREGACQIGSTQMIWFGDRPDAAVIPFRADVTAPPRGQPHHRVPEGHQP